MQINKFPILIYANYRTGSSPLLSALAIKYGLERYSEPHYDIDKLSKLKQDWQTSNYVVKFMPDQIADYPIYQKILASDCYKIRLTRENKIDQIASFYIASYTDRWHTDPDVVVEDYEVDIDTAILDNAVRTIRYNDKLLAESTVKFDLDTTYEQLGYFEELGPKTHQPTNLDELRRAILNHIRDVNAQFQFNLFL